MSELSSVKEELESAKWNLGQAQKALANYSEYSQAGKDYCVSSAKRELQDVFQRIHRALLIDSGVEVKVPR